MNYYLKTQEYYSKWLDAETSVFSKNGVVLQVSKERDKQQVGYPKPYQIYAIEKDDLVVISYSERVKEDAFELEKQLIVRKESIQTVFEKMFPKGLSQNYLFYLDMLVDTDTSGVVQLQKSDYEVYLDFFKAQYPEADPSEWLEHYFYSLVDKGVCFGIMCDGKLVCVTDAPEVPYMSDVMVEPGINTLDHYRHRGYAKKVVVACCREVIRQGKVPMWSCYKPNRASKALAESVGFKLFGECYTVSK